MSRYLQFRHLISAFRIYIIKNQIDTIIIGAGQAGLATSRCLTDRGIEHVIFERGEVGERWLSERWSSLHLLTPNWMTRLPNFAYSGSEPNGYMHKNLVASYLSDYKNSFNAPVLTRTQVLSVTQHVFGFQVKTDSATWHARAVVIATGACDKANVPDFAHRIGPEFSQVTPASYKSPEQIAPGGVLIVGASATGVQLADELLAAGREVTLAVGSHTRVPRTYRGQDVMFWMDQTGMLATPRDPDADPEVAFRHPSLQLVGCENSRNIDLKSLQKRGAEIVGRATDADGSCIKFEPSLYGNVAAADKRQRRILQRIDAHIEANGIYAPQSPTPIPVEVQEGPKRIDLIDKGISTVLWATGYRREYPWLNVPVLTASGEIQQLGGVTPLAGFFAMGLPFMRRRNSTYIDGAGFDARMISQHVSNHLEHSKSLAA